MTSGVKIDVTGNYFNRRKCRKSLSREKRREFKTTNRTLLIDIMKMFFICSITEKMFMMMLKFNY